jgi:hypothetical protein
MVAKAGNQTGTSGLIRGTQRRVTSLTASQRDGSSGRLTMAAISHVSSRVAEMLGEAEDWLQDISIEMDPEDGRLTVRGTGEETITAFTHLGVENLAEIVEI